MTLIPMSPSNQLVPFVISSCGKYSEVLEISHRSIKDAFPSLPVFVVTDAKLTFVDSATCFQKKDLGWNKNLLFLLDMMPARDFVILTMDDLEIVNSVSEHYFMDLINFFIANELDYVSLYSPPAVKLKRAVNADFQMFSPIDADHSISTMCSLIRVDLLRFLLSNTETPWEFERLSYRYVKGYKCMNLNFNAVVLSNMIVQGKKIFWRNKKNDRTTLELLFGVKYFFKVIGYSLGHLAKSKWRSFLIK